MQQYIPCELIEKEILLILREQTSIDCEEKWHKNGAISANKFDTCITLLSRWQIIILHQPIDMGLTLINMLGIFEILKIPSNSIQMIECVDMDFSKQHFWDEEQQRSTSHNNTSKSHDH